jgi:hypothetical protein
MTYHFERSDLQSGSVSPLSKEEHKHNVALSLHFPRTTIKKFNINQYISCLKITLRIHD